MEDKKEYTATQEQLARFAKALGHHARIAILHLLSFRSDNPVLLMLVIPLFIGFVNGGIPLGVIFVYLITSSLVNELAVAMFIGVFGVRITAIYVVSGIVLGTAGG